MVKKQDLKENFYIYIKHIKSSEGISLAYKGLSEYNQNIELILRKLNNLDIDEIPNIYSLAYICNYKSDNKILTGYNIRNYNHLQSLNKIKNFDILKQKVLELIDIYLLLKDEYNICYSDFEKVFINKGKILLLGIDSFYKKNDELEKESDQLLINFVISLIYKINYFKLIIYTTPKEINEILLNNEINSIDDFKKNLEDETKSSVKVKRKEFKSNQCFYLN